MWIKFILVIAVPLVCWSCGQKQEEKVANTSTGELGMSSIHFEMVCHGDNCSYIHFVTLSSYEESKFNDYDFVFLADKYLDSVKTHLPVAAIEFCRPFNFDDIGGSENDEQFERNAIALLWYNWEKEQSKVPEIRHIAIWTNGQRKDLDYLDIETRQRAMKFYNSKE